MIMLIASVVSILAIISECAAYWAYRVFGDPLNRIGLSTNMSISVAKRRDALLRLTTLRVRFLHVTGFLLVILVIALHVLAYCLLRG